MSPEDFTHSYVYDLVGNRLERQVADGNTTYYFYDPNTDELTRELTDDVNTFYEYDDNGSLVEESNDAAPFRTYTYNYRNRLSSVSAGGTTVDYKYNPEGIRVEAAVQSGSTTKYIIDPYNHTGYSQVLREVVDTAANTAYILGLDVLARAKNTDMKYLLYDGHGSVRHLANSSGVIAESYAYDAYGNAHTFNPASASNALLYAGEMWDNDLQHYYLRARWYSPATGRFNRLDPFAGNNRDPQSLHKYLYAHSNPIYNIDPSGNRIGGPGTFGLLVTITIWTAIALVVNAACIFAYRALGISDFRRGIDDESLVTDQDIIAFIEGLRIGRRAIYLVTQKDDILDVPAKWGDTWEALNDFGVFQVGQMGVGVVGIGNTQSPGYQQLIRYFETRWWNWWNPEARPHRSWAAYHTIDNPLYIRDWGGWAIQRYEIIARRLMEEARRRGDVPVPDDINQYLSLDNLSAENIQEAYTGGWTPPRNVPEEDVE